MALNINGTTGISGVEGSVSAPVLTGTDSNCGISFPAADTIKCSTGGVERMSITNSGVSGITAGITQSSTFRLTSNTSIDSSQVVLTSNLEESDNASYTRVGSAFTQSSGLFTFPATGDLRFNSTLGSAEIYNGSAFAAVGGGSGTTGGGSDELFLETDQTMTTNYTLTANKNAMTISPVINSGVTLTVPSGAILVIL